MMTRSQEAAIHSASELVDAIMHESVKNIDRGKPTIWRPGSEIGVRFNSEYQTWMELRASVGDSFALSLGYGKSHT